MSKLDDVMKGLEHTVLNSQVSQDEFRADIWFKITDETKQQIKDVMRETYNKALQAYFIDKTATSLDEAIEKAVDAL